jgi:thymidylate kinase
MKKNLIVTVSGVAGSGKSSLTFLLKNFLREHGFEVEQELNLDHPTESNFDQVMNDKFKIKAIKENCKIILKRTTT